MTHRQLRIFIRHSITGQYLTASSEWTKDAEDAETFDTTEAALELLHESSMEDAEVVLSLQRPGEKTFSTRSPSARRILNSVQPPKD